jgi:hypothetical protein
MAAPPRTATRRPPWKKPRPAGATPARLTAAQKAEARARAEKAGRRYPNLIDNMAVLRGARTAAKR